MTSLRHAILYGFLVWLIPFAVSFVIFPFHESNRPLFESIMAVTVAAVVVVCGLAYLRATGGVSLREMTLVGLLWLVISVLIDAPLMLLGGPMLMSVGAYAADIGVTYLMIPVITTGLGKARMTGR